MKQLQLILLISALTIVFKAEAGQKCIEVNTKCPDGRWVTSSCDSTANPCGSSSGGSSGSGGYTPQEQILLQGAAEVGNAIGQYLRGNPEEDARRKAEEDASAARRRRQEEETLKRHEEETLKRHEEMKNRLLGGMLNVGDSSQLGLMGVDSGSGLSLMTGDQAVSASSLSPNKPIPSNDQANSKPKSASFTKGFEDASQCYSQNSGSRCAGLTAEQQQTCIADYRAGYADGDKQRVRLMQEATQAGQFAGERGELANGASDPLADGPCRVEWIKAYNSGYFGAKHAPSRESKPAIAAVAKVDSEEARNVASDLPKGLDNAIASVYSSAPPGVSDSVRKGFQAVMERDWKVAKARFQDALSRDPTNPGLKRLVALTDSSQRPNPQRATVDARNEPAGLGGRSDAKGASATTKGAQIQRPDPNDMNVLLPGMKESPKTAPSAGAQSQRPDPNDMNALFPDLKAMDDKEAQDFLFGLNAQPPLSNSVKAK